jgi:hypothetical protein
MTKHGIFKRAVRQRAADAGQRYTAARAAMDAVPLAVPVDDLMREIIADRYAPLKAHLESVYGMRIVSLTAMDDHHPATLRVQHQDGPTWIARVSSDAGFSSSATRVNRVAGDAEILQFLAAHDFPAERLAHDEPVSVLEERGVLVTHFIEGGRPDETPSVQCELGTLLGRLHALPAAGGAIGRDGGSFDHDAGFVGRPSENLSAAMSFLVSVEDRVSAEGRERFEWLLHEVDNADGGDDLPEALTHGNYFGPASAVGKPGNLSIVAWGGSGRGPRLHALAWLLLSSAGNARAIEAMVRGYREHVQVTDEELDRLLGAMKMWKLYFTCWSYRSAVAKGDTPSGAERWWPKPEYPGLQRIAIPAVAAFRS